jgi:hypothetical protein
MGNPLIPLNSFQNGLLAVARLGLHGKSPPGLPVRRGKLALAQGGSGDRFTRILALR